MTRLIAALAGAFAASAAIVLWATWPELVTYYRFDRISDRKRGW